MAGWVISTYLGMKSFPSVPSMPAQVAAKVNDLRTSPICALPRKAGFSMSCQRLIWTLANPGHLRFHTGTKARSEEHTSELQSLAYLVCRLLLEKKKERN